MNEIQLLKRSENYNEWSFEKLKLNRQELIPPSSDSSAGCLTDKAANADDDLHPVPFEESQNIKAIRRNWNRQQWEVISNWFQRMINNKYDNINLNEWSKGSECMPVQLGNQYHPTMSDIAVHNNPIPNIKQDSHNRSNTQYIFNISDLSARRSETQFENLKIEDRLMQRHIHSQLKIDQLRRAKQNQELYSLKDRPDINKNTEKILGKNKLSNSIRDSSLKSKMKIEQLQKEQNERVMKEFTGKPQINERSRKMCKSSSLGFINPKPR